jgi:prepilin-type N-terminal cleavage/methylation domain-containing protein
VDGKTPANFRVLRRSGFTLIEVLIVVIIMAILVGVTSSIIAGFSRMFEATTDHVTAKRRANDVFSILGGPVLNAGVGMPGSGLGPYFSGSPLSDWDRPVEVISGDKDNSPFEGNALKIVYAFPTGIKNGGREIDDFMPSDAGYASNIQLTAAGKFSDGDPMGIIAGKEDTRSFIVFPGMNMYPVFVSDITGAAKNGLLLRGRTPPPPAEGEKNVFSNVISPYHDIYTVRAGVAFVLKKGGSSNFYLLDICDTDMFTEKNPEHINMNERSGFRVEGVRGVSFDIGPGYKSLTVWVLTEGEIADSGRDPNSVTARAVRDRWKPLLGENALNPQVYYEDFTMTWRMRNVRIK